MKTVVGLKLTCPPIVTSKNTIGLLGFEGWTFMAVFRLLSLQTAEMRAINVFQFSHHEYHERFKNVHQRRHYGNQEDFLRMQPRDNYDWESRFFFSRRDVCTQSIIVLIYKFQKLLTIILIQRFNKLPYIQGLLEPISVSRAKDIERSSCIKLETVIIFPE